jgi:hypothetical protein
MYVIVIGGFQLFGNYDEQVVEWVRVGWGGKRALLESNGGTATT